MTDIKMDLINEILDRYSLRMNNIKERNDFHPEASLFFHTLTVMDNVRKYNNVDLLLSALFHDIGKVYTYEKYGNSYGHELTSAWIVMEYHNKIKDCGGNVDKIWWLVLNHLKGGKIIEGENNKNDYLLTTHKYWNDLVKLAKADNMLNDSDKDIKHFLNKRVYVSTGNKTRLSGICDFIGYNNHFNYKVVVINRMPVRIDNYNLVCSYVNPMSVRYR